MLAQARLLRPVLARLRPLSGVGLGAALVHSSGLRLREGDLGRGGPGDSDDDFKPKIKAPEDVASAHENILEDVQNNPVMVYMKGMPSAPQCGFSATVCRILDVYGVKYSSRNVLADSELREGIKSFSNWPTIPQVYVHGQFLGGSDILLSMHRSGELKEKLKDLMDTNSNVPNS